MCQAGPNKVACVGKAALLVVSLSKQEKSRIRTLFKPKSLQTAVSAVAAPSSGSYIAMIQSNLLQLRSTGKGQQGCAAVVRHYSWLTCVSVSSDGAMVAVGDEAGAVFVYRNPCSLLPNAPRSVRLEQSAAPSSKLHWHSSAVRALSFSHDGNVLVSGGAEAALVTWQMTRNHFGTKSFLPRLGAPILAISVSNDESLYCLTQADNSVRLVDQASRTITSTIRGIQAIIGNLNLMDHAHSLSSQLHRNQNPFMGITRDPRREGYVMIFGTGSKVQSYDLFKGKHISDACTIPGNIVHGPKTIRGQAKRPAPPITTLVKLGPSGNVMVTVDKQFLCTNPSKEFDIEKDVTTLRFWNLEPNNDVPSMVSLFRQPHGVGNGISSVCIHPRKPVVVTTSCDGKFKLWREVKGIKGERSIWRSEAQLGYKGLPCTSACFSNDGSILGVGCGSVLTVWHVEDLMAGTSTTQHLGADADERPELESPSSVKVELLHALVHPPSEEKIKSVSFVYKQCPLFIAATETGIYVWNAITLGILWSSRIRTYPGMIATNETHGIFAIAVKIPSIVAVADTSAEEKQIDFQEVYSDDEVLSKARRRFTKSTRSPSAQSTSGGKDSRKSRDKLAKRERPKRKFEAVEQSGSSFTGTSAKTNSLDTAIVFFDASSPYPLRVSRLTAGADVMSLEFVENSSMDQAMPPPLACVNSSLDICFYSVSDSADDKLSLLTSSMSPETQLKSLSSTTVGKLESLLGKHEHVGRGDKIRSSGLPIAANYSYPTSSTSATETEVVGLGRNQTSLAQAFERHFDGPVHVQAGVSSKSFHFIQTLLKGVQDGTQNNVTEAGGKLDSVKNAVEAAEGVASTEGIAYGAADLHRARYGFFCELVDPSPNSKQPDDTTSKVDGVQKDTFIAQKSAKSDRKEGTPKRKKSEKKSRRRKAKVREE
ncbi:unnamed protein product [Chondrus crispus]|uniref:WD repeat-containing protein 75 second beta-propeller domain-containing protein n=1 Tax=Chondrus crispus TaxID=2769 RepID=R7QF79_CHOCR|nr:unnamed protein product [Chondrus crispus]CDF36096.1 unnamed protein product [Chondrus crispus]|eukprot:XP_005715915.1 unnamed protein product [Chondrus crispus]